MWPSTYGVKCDIYVKLFCLNPPWKPFAHFRIQWCSSREGVITEWPLNGQFHDHRDVILTSWTAVINIFQNLTNGMIPITSRSIITPSLGVIPFPISIFVLKSKWFEFQGCCPVLLFYSNCGLSPASISNFILRLFVNLLSPTDCARQICHRRKHTFHLITFHILFILSKKGF